MRAADDRALEGQQRNFFMAAPPIAMLTVFYIGDGEASTYSRTRSLLAPRLLGATRNASIMAVPVLLS
jgi:hypothetical protein